MENVEKVWLGPLPPDSPYVKPFRFYFIQNGIEKNWDLLKVHDSVAIIIFNTTRNALVFVKQFRPAVYHGVVTAGGAEFGDVDLKKFPPKLGITLELCAGIVDKDKSWIEIAREEVLEECGYDIPINRIEEVLTFRSGVGSSGSQQKMYYCEVTDADMVSSGGGVDGEVIEVVEYSLEDARKLVSQAAYHGSVTAGGAEFDDVDLKKFPPKLGITLEMCGGMVDKDKSWKEIAREEVLEECGYDVPVNRIEEVLTYRSAVGSSGSQQKMYYCEVTDADMVSNGGGVDEEVIEVVEYSLEDARKLVSQGAINNSPPGFLLGVLWFLTNKAPKA